MPPETQQMAELADAAAARERRRNSKLRTSETVAIEGDLTLEDLRFLVDRTDLWPSESPVTFREYSTTPGEQGSTPARITLTRKD